MKHRWKMTMTAALMCLLAACTSENPGGSTTDDTGIGLDAAADAADDTGMGDIGPRDTDPNDVDPGDVDPGDADGDAGADAETDGGSDPGRTIADYRRCFSDTECPVGLGSCIKEVSLNRADANGVDTVAIGDIFEELEDGQGICTAICTESADACAPLSVNGTTPDPVAHVCQVVVLGEAPYPGSAPSFPFDDQLDPAEQTSGQPFGAICRPPFELDDDVNSSFCSQCQSANDCAASGSLCWSTFANAPVAEGDTGICLSGCADQSDCPMGFTCDAQVDGQSYCRPTLDTCTDCQDVDDDGFGTGRCGTDNQPVTPHDCDDRNADAFFNPSDMEHAFPTFCGQQDFNCNGLSDEAEEVGADAFPAEHCTACFDTCEGAIDNGQRACQTSGSDNADQPACMAQCDVDANGDPTHADCDGDITNGCEVPIDDASRLYYADVDADGYGDASDVVFACDPSLAPSGYVSNSDDCNDTSDQAWGGSSPAEEICDGIDNDCDGDVDEAIAQQDTSCSTGEAGVCDAGTWQCQGSAGFECVGDILPGTRTESCDGVDNDCDGDVDEDGADGSTAYYPDADQDTYGDETAAARYACEQPAGYVTDNTDCNDDPTTSGYYVHPGQNESCMTDYDDNCDGAINEDTAYDALTWYADSDADSYGNPNSSTKACTQPTGYVDRAGDCDDLEQQVNPQVREACGNATDDNCDGKVDDSTAHDASVSYADRDGDRYGDPQNTTRACGIPTGYTSNNTDCNDDPTAGGMSANPSRSEVCDGIDNDCNGSEDEGCPTYWAQVVGGVITKALMGYDDSTYTTPKTMRCGDADGTDRVWTNATVLYHDKWPVQKINIGCRNLVIEEDTTTTPTYSYNVSTARSADWIHGYGKGEGTYRTGNFACGDGEAIYKVSTKIAGLIQGITFHCRSYDIFGSAGSMRLQSVSSTTVTAYGNSNGTALSAECSGSDEVAVGMRTYTGEWDGWDSVYGIELMCRSVEPHLK